MYKYTHASFREKIVSPLYSKGKDRDYVYYNQGENFTPFSIPYLSYVYKYARYVSLRNKKIVSTEIMYTTCWHYNQSIDPTRYYYFVSIHHFSLGRETFLLFLFPIYNKGDDWNYVYYTYWHYNQSIDPNRYC